ncbi:MAG: sigma-70 family RNA polymerase sigma factor [Chthoniobacter sp.]|uniref:RNA polymerase sigma factor n=1 Tax=Chthoniobacter sp. TaxID=2510640 RepID=UPI0032AA6851
MPDRLAETAPASPLATLTQRMAAGDEAAFAEWHGIYATRLFRYVLVLQRGDEHSAADVLQETLLRVARHIRRFDEEHAFWDWLAKLARSAAADQGRKRSRYLRFLDLFRAQPPAPAPPEREALAAALEAALAQLREADAALLRAKYDDDLSQRDLAARLAISEEALESRLRRAHAALRTRAFQILNKHQP